MKKRFLSILSAIAVLLSTTTAYAQPAETEVQTEQTLTEVTGEVYYATSVETQSADGRFTYLVYPATKTAALKRCHDITSKSITVPETIEYEGSTYTITEIYGYNGTGKCAFEDNNLVERIILPDTIKTIGPKAFKHCESLKNFELPKYIETIGNSAFENCDSVTSIFIPKSLKTILYTDIYSTKGPFADCPNLKTVTFESGLDEIPHGLFNRCNGLETINIPNSITAIGANAFFQCANLKTVNFPDNLISIGKSAFAGCPNLTGVKLPKNLQETGSAAFGSCPSIKSIEIPKSLQNATIGEYNVDGPFAKCDNLKIVTFEAGTTTLIDDLLNNSTGIETINIPDSVTTISRRVFKNCKNLANIIFTNKSRVKIIGFEAFKNCSSLITQDLPCKYLETIGDGVFQDCTNLTTVTLPNSITEIGESAF